MNNNNTKRMGNFDRSRIILTTLVVVLLSFVVSADGVLWSPCSLHSEFYMPEGVKFFPRANLTKLEYTLSMIDAINEISMCLVYSLILP